MKQTILTFGGLIVALLVLFQLSKYSMLFGDAKIEVVIAVIALIFFFIGMYFNKRNKSTSYNERLINYKKIEQLDISKREYQVLQEIAKGLSNKEIADKLCLSESTIKTHVSNLLVKLDAKRRTQAIQKAKGENII